MKPTKDKAGDFSLDRKECQIGPESNMIVWDKDNLEKNVKENKYIATTILSGRAPVVRTIGITK